MTGGASGQHEANRSHLELVQRLTFADLERRLGVKPGFLLRLRDDDNDWSFLVRLQPFIEGALAHAIVLAIEPPQLAGFVNSMHLKSQHGLANLALSLGLISKEQNTLLDKLAEVRNAFAHKLSNVDRSLAEYVRSLDDGCIRGLLKALVPRGKNDQLPKGNDARTALGDSIRTLFWWNAALLSVDLLSSITKAERGQMRRAGDAAGPAADA